MNLRKRFLTGIVTGVGSVGIKTALNILLIPVFMKTLGLTYYSLYVLLLGILDFSQILDMGLASALVKTLATEQAQASALLKMSHIFYVTVSLTALVAGWLAIPFLLKLFHISPQLSGVTHLALIILFLEGALTLYTCYFRAVLWAHCLHQWTNLSETLFNTTSILVGLLLLLTGHGLIAMLATRLVAAVLRSMVLISQALKVEPAVLFPKALFHLKTFQDLMGLTWNALLIKLSIQISHKIDTFVIAAFLPLPMVGVYEIIFRFLSLVSQLADKIAEVILPLYGHLLATEKSGKVQRFFIRISSFLNVFACLLLLNIVWFFPKLLVIFTDGKITFAQTATVLCIAVPFIWSGVMQYPAAFFLFSSGKERFLAISSIVTAFANLFLSLVLVQSLGIAGVALGTLIPQFFQHQFSLVKQALQDLNLSLGKYLLQVHGQGILPLIVAVGVLICLLPLNHLPIPPFLIILLAGLLSIGAGGTVWLFFNTTRHERQAVFSGHWNDLQ